MSSAWPTEYAYLPDLTCQQGHYRIRPIHWDDRTAIRTWRNEQIAILRQASPLSEEDQDRYFEHIVRPQFSELHPPQLLWAFLEDDQLVGYGGLVHFEWSDLRAEVSFLTETARVPGLLSRDWETFLSLLIPVARQHLTLHKLTTETYSSRPDLIPVLESVGFVQEGTLRQHHRVKENWVDSLAHGLLLD